MHTTYNSTQEGDQGRLRCSRLVDGSHGPGGTPKPEATRETPTNSGLFKVTPLQIQAVRQKTRKNWVKWNKIGVNS